MSFFRLGAVTKWFLLAFTLLAVFEQSVEAQESGQSVDADVFLKEAVKVLPIQPRYAYHKSFLDGSMHTPSRNPKTQPEEHEIEIDDDWRVVVLSSGPLAQYGGKDTIEFLQLAMHVKLAAVESANDVSQAKQIVAGTIGDFEKVGIQIGGKLTSRKSYEVRVDNGQVLVCGYDDAGVMHGLFYLQSLMRLREAPYLQSSFKAVRNSLFQSRFVLSWLGWMQWPDKYLAHLAHDGYDAIYASVYANPNGVPGPPHYDLIREQKPARLRELVARAKKYGIRVYAPIMFNNTGEPENKAALREHVRDIVTKFPGIHGYILLTEGFYYKKFFGAGGHGKQDLKQWAKEWTDAVKIVVEECHRVDPTIEVLPWEYNIDFRPNRVEIKKHVVNLLPKDCIPLLTWENGKSFPLGPFTGYLRDYSISQVGPAEVAEAQIKETKLRGMKAYCKSDCFATWQFGTTPYLPCPQQWQRRYEALASHGVDGTLETWSNGYKPNFVAELRCWSAWGGGLSNARLLQLMASRLFGEKNTGTVVQAWEHFSRAIQLVPDTGPSMGTNNAVAHPLFLDEPEPRMMTLNNSWWDEAKKTSWRHRMIPAWPYCHRMMVFLPDFKNRVNQAENYATRRSGVYSLPQAPELKGKKLLPIFNQRLMDAADELEKGLKLYRAAALASPEWKREKAIREVLVVEQMQRMVRGLHAILEFEDLRLKLADPNVGSRDEILNRMEVILQDEIQRTKQSIATTERDSRLGYECEMDYVYTPRILREKLDLLEETLKEQLPRRRDLP